MASFLLKEKILKKTYSTTRTLISVLKRSVQLQSIFCERLLVITDNHTIHNVHKKRINFEKLTSYNNTIRNVHRKLNLSSS